MIPGEAYIAELLSRIRAQKAGSTIPNMEAEFDESFAMVHRSNGSYSYQPGRCASCGQQWPCEVLRRTAAKYGMPLA